MTDDRPVAPALQLCRIELRPRGPLESLDLAVRVAHDWWRPLALLTALTLLPAFALCAAIGWLAGGNPWALLAPVLLGPIAQAPFTVLGGRLLFAEDVRLRDVATHLAGRVGPWVGCEALIAASATCLPVYLVAQVPLVFCAECVLLERVALPRAFRRSWRLTSGYAGGAVVGVMGRWVLLAWFAIVAEASVQALAQVFQVSLPLPRAIDGVATPWLMAGILASHPVWAIWRLLLYVDVRTRVEGWDLQVGLRAAGLAR